ncbi:unnamed protein product, partial [Medioppia subpectinata]
MPSIKWSVEPTYPCRRPLEPDKCRVGELEGSAHHALVGALRQLASLVRIAERVLGDVTDECHTLCERTLRLRARVDRCQRAVHSMNARAVRIPVGNLNDFMQLDTFYKSKQTADQQLFKLDTRPVCIRDAYLSAALTPLHIIRSIDSYRDDGRSGSKLFICQPVFADSRKRVNFDIETRR